MLWLSGFLVLWNRKRRHWWNLLRRGSILWISPFLLSLFLPLNVPCLVVEKENIGNRKNKKLIKVCNFNLFTIWDLRKRVLHLHQQIKTTKIIFFFLDGASPIFLQVFQDTFSWIWIFLNSDLTVKSLSWAEMSCGISEWITRNCSCRTGILLNQTARS